MGGAVLILSVPEKRTDLKSGHAALKRTGAQAGLGGAVRDVQQLRPDGSRLLDDDQVPSYQLRITNYELRITNYSAISSN